ncbi:OmpA family protein [Erwinia sorbitola]|uniref:OmpA family protein n=1 Tax=Erwinia sorbitola TaxID=2681984 RepID=A0A6I6EX43_9GAMM|nr:OmpA family protein [Erwinia sorbitola]QGU89192.1 OmpA family protein [Erwinia sorbitola]
MRRVIKLFLVLLTLLLALWLIWGFLPLGNDSRIFLSLFCLVLAVAWGWRYRREARTEQQPIDEKSLPPEQFAGAVVLVCGASDRLFPAGQAFRETRQGWYIAVSQPEELERLADSFAAARPALIARLSILLAVIPEQWQDADAFNQQLLRWQRAIANSRQAFSGLPPIWCSVWLNAIQDPTENGCCWYSLTHNHESLQVQDNAAVAQAYISWCQQRGAETELPRLSSSLWLQALFSWLNSRVLEVLAIRNHDTPALRPCMLAICTTPVSAVADNLWQQHIAAVTTLPVRPDSQNVPTLPLPDALLAHLPHRHGVSVAMQSWRLAGLLIGIFLLLAMLASWINNQRLIQNVSDHLAIYQRLTGTPAGPKVQAQKQLQRDAGLLDGWQRDGVPIRYSLGLYQGMRLIAPLRASINDWAPPQPVPVINKIVQGPTTLRLDSLSLFDSGKSALKSGSEKVLINALVGIKAKPGWLIVVSGHTDNTGNALLNQTLSIQRAAAVRDWMLSTSDVSESCFAVQGHGASRPIATNDTAAGRALNRRVEISLVPQADACQAAETLPASGVDAGITPSKEN